MAKSSRGPSAPTSRRDRREAQRAERRGQREALATRSGLPVSPVLLVTIGAIVLGLIVVVVVSLQGRAQAPLVAPAASVAVPAALADDRAIGSADAPVTLDVWSDFQCPACLAYWTAVNPKVVTDYVAPGKVRIVYHDFVFIGPESTAAAVAARCANQQGHADFWLYHDYLYANQGAENSGAFSRERLIGMASMAGLDTNALGACLDEASVAQAVQAETDQGHGLGVHQTPTLMIGSQMLAAFDEPSVAKALDAALAQTGVTASPSVSPGAGQGASASPAGSASVGASASP
ncbi:MAG TPA: thioredoxin domain-containing protein [Candidatus Limnocylindrales bacterium]|nr:thioredoxin domain-containing protein [Candidatus Limnocylindrales bacterium]